MSQLNKPQEFYAWNKRQKSEMVMHWFQPRLIDIPCKDLFITSELWLFMCLKFQAKIENDFADVEKSEKHCYLWRIE